MLVYQRVSPISWDLEGRNSLTFGTIRFWVFDEKMMRCDGRIRAVARYSTLNSKKKRVEKWIQVRNAVSIMLMAVTSEFLHHSEDS